MSILESAARFFSKRDTAPETTSRRSMSRVMPRRGMYDITGGHSLVPQYPEFSPMGITLEQRYLQSIARALYLNNGWVRNLVNVLCETYFSGAPTPMSRYPEMNDLFEKASADFDNRGVHSYSGWLRQDLERNRLIDGEVFARKRSRWMRDGRGRLVPDPSLLIPLQYQALTSEYVPLDDNLLHAGGRRVAGITYDLRERPVSYRMHREHPRSLLAVADPMNLLDVPANEVYHYFDPMTGSPRGDVPLAAALLRAIKLSTLDDAEIRRKLTAQLTSMMIETSWDMTVDDSFLPSEETVMQMIEEIDLVPGGIIRVPPGHKARFETPPDEPQNFEKSFRFQLLQICATAGANFHEVTGDVAGMTERLLKFIAVNTQRKARILHDNCEHQVLRWQWRDAVDEGMTSGAWAPPMNVHPRDLYHIDWQWPVTQTATLTQDLNALMAAEEKGVIPAGYTSRNLFGLSPETVARQNAKEHARRQILGDQRGVQTWQPTTEVAQSVYVEAAIEEITERSIVEAALTEDSPLINGTKPTIKVPPPVVPEPRPLPPPR